MVSVHKRGEISGFQFGVFWTSMLFSVSCGGAACHLWIRALSLTFSVDILLNRSQQLFASCTAKFADGQQCSIPVFDITHQTPLCEEHAKKMVNIVFRSSQRCSVHEHGKSCDWKSPAEYLQICFDVSFD